MYSCKLFTVPTVHHTVPCIHQQEVGLVSMVINAAAEPVNTSDLHGDLDDDDVFLDALRYD